MPQPVRPRRYSHMNLVVEDFDASVAHFQDLFGAGFLFDLPAPAWHAYLIDIGGAIIEVFVPLNFLLNSRQGPHHLGLEFEADLTEARAASADHHLRIMREVPHAFHTHPADGYGVDYEFFEGSFYPDASGEKSKFLPVPCKPAEYWRDEHPLGLMGVKGYTQAVSGLAEATAFMQSYFDAKLIYQEDRPALAARAAGLQIAEITCELLAPVGDGALRRELERSGQGIRSTVFRTSGIGKVEQYFAARNITLVPGTAPGSLAIPPAANLGLQFEFAE